MAADQDVIPIVQSKLIATTCPYCGVAFAIPERLDERLRRTHQTFWCPQGHTQLYAQETETDRLGAEVARLTRELAEARAEIARLTTERAAAPAPQQPRRHPRWWGPRGTT